MSKESAAKWRAANPEKQRARVKKWRADNRKHYNEYSRNWCRANSLKCSKRNRVDAEKQKAWLNELRSAPCMDCGGSFPPECMDYDHRPGEVKLFCVTQTRRQKAIILAEIAKCDLVCSNCHRIRTKKRLKEQ